MSKKQIVLLIILMTWTTWLVVLGITQAWYYLSNYWQIAVTMLFGSMIAGGTSLGGGAVAFPVFTKLLHISPTEAKLFSLAIQSVGMTAASVSICLTKIKVEWRFIFWSSWGGIIGIFLGLKFLSNYLPPDVVKMSFTTMLFSFGITLLMVKHNLNPQSVPRIQFNLRDNFFVFFLGLMGGLITSFIGNGIDILLFSAMILMYKLDEKIATSTSVVIMALNALAGFIIQLVFIDKLPETVYSYWLAAIPVVVFGAPFGAVCCSKMTRQTIINILLLLITCEVISSILLIPMKPIILITSAIVLGIFSGFNYWMYQSSRRNFL